DGLTAHPGPGAAMTGRPGPARDPGLGRPDRRPPDIRHGAGAWPPGDGLSGDGPRGPATAT
ncbi:hypothetical protein NUG23_35145, partial [Streptomyces sp. PAL114]|nr:hypothetical protein [Streptomyces sp. PAL114]